MKSKKVQKPWGYEVWFAQTDKYVGKLLVIKKGKRLSYQYHEQKDETLWVLSGLGKIIVDDKVTTLKAGRAIHIPPNTKHRIEATEEDLEIIEVSTPEVDDVVRLADDYGR